MFRIKYCREIILKLLFQIDVMKDPAASGRELLSASSDFFKGLTDDEIEFISGVVDNALTNLERIDRLITQNLIGWKISRLTPVDRNLLRMGISEADQNDQKAIIIDDMVRIAKKYGEEDSYKIVNAVLDKVL